MPVKLRNPVSRKVQLGGQDFIVTIGHHGVSIRAARHHKGVSLSYKELAATALAQLDHLRWPKHLQDNPLAQLQHLTDRQV